MGNRGEQRSAELERARRGLIRASKLRIVEACLALVIAVALAVLAGVDKQHIAVATAAAFLVGLVGDQFLRHQAKSILGDNPLNIAPRAVKHAIRRASAPLGINPDAVHVRRVPGVGEARHSGFAAGALPVRAGAVILLGDVVAERAKTADDAGIADGDRRFAYDELRSVLGHELAHIMPGTHSSDRLPAVIVRSSYSIVDLTLWTMVAFANLWVAIVGLAVTGLVRLIGGRVRRAKAPLNVLLTVATAAASYFSIPDFGLSHVLVLSLFLVWPIARPVPALVIQRQIEHRCDEVAVAGGGDPYALARILQRFEPETMKYYEPPLWIALNQSHPPLHKRIVDLDHSQSRAF